MGEHQDDEPVGYGKPPRQHRIKPNEVRNPYGRKGKPRPAIDFLDEPCVLKIDGRTITTTRDSALDYSLFKQAIAGKVSATKELERRRRERAKAAKIDSVEVQLKPEDQQAFERYMNRALRDRSAKGIGSKGQGDDSEGRST